MAVGGLQFVAIQLWVPEIKNEVAGPIGVTVMVTVLPGVSPETVYVKTLPIAPTLTTGLAPIW